MKFKILLFWLLSSTISAHEAALDSLPFCEIKEVIGIDSTTIEGKLIKILADSGYSVGMQKIMLAQAKLESGNFKNNLTKKWNNVFSMLHSSKDPYSIGNWARAEGRSGYAVYKSIEESIYARIWYSRRWNYPDNVSPDEYVRHIKSKGYFTGNEQEYLKCIKALIKRDAFLFENKSVTIVCR